MSGEARLVGFDFPIGLPLAYARRVGIGDFLAALPRLGHGEWNQFYDLAESPGDSTPYRPFYPRRPGGSSHKHLCEALGAGSQPRALGGASGFALDAHECVATRPSPAPHLKAAS